MAKSEIVVDAGSDTELGPSWGLKEALGVDDRVGKDWGGLWAAEALMAISNAIFATYALQRESCWVCDSVLGWWIRESVWWEISGQKLTPWPVISYVAFTL